MNPKIQHIYPMNPQNHMIDFKRLAAFSRLCLHRFGLTGKFHINDIHSEVYIRFEKAKLKGRISNDPEHPQRWARTTVKFVIQEFSRKESRATATDTMDANVADETQLPMENLEKKEAYAFLHEAIALLSDDDALLIKLRFFESMEWEAIANYLLAETGEHIKIPTLRKRGERSLNKLREHYLNKACIHPQV